MITTLRVTPELDAKIKICVKILKVDRSKFIRQLLEKAYQDALAAHPELAAELDASRPAGPAANPKITA